MLIVMVAIIMMQLSMHLMLLFMIVLEKTIFYCP